jgi:hypothetical protein
MSLPTPITSKRLGLLKSNPASPSPPTLGCAILPSSQPESAVVKGRRRSLLPPVLGLLLLVASTSDSHASPRTEGEPRLGLIAVPRYGPFPLTVQFQGQIYDADEHDPALYCLDADWDFDHTRFFDRKDCPPYEEGSTIRKSYATSHTFELPGTYRVRLSLRRGENTVLMDEVWIRVSLAKDENAPGSTSIDITSTPIRAEVSDLLQNPDEYLYRPIIVKGKLGSLPELGGPATLVLELTLHDRRSWEKTIRVRVRGGQVVGVPIGDEVEVTGVLRTENPVRRDDWRLLEPPKDIWIEADSIDSLEYDVKAPEDSEPLTELAPPRPSRSSGPPPEVLFTLPLDQERGIDLDTTFQIQFSDDMNPQSFAGNVVLEYVDENEPSPEVELSYDEMSRTLSVQPERLLPAREVRLIIFDGVVNEDGVPLVPILRSRRASLDRRSGRMKALSLTFFTRQ